MNIDDWPVPEDIPDCPPLPCDNEPIDWEALWCDPIVDPTTWIADDAIVNGRVSIGRGSSVWHLCVIRGDGQFIKIGDECNVQDGCVLHIDASRPCILGNRVSLGHRAIVHASTVEDEALIAMSATVLSNCRIGKGAIVAAGALVLEGTVVPAGTIWAGCPAKQIGTVTSKHAARIRHTWEHYVNQTVAMIARRDAGQK